MPGEIENGLDKPACVGGKPVLPQEPGLDHLLFIPVVKIVIFDLPHRPPPALL
jgi:hypothetical protein